MNWTSRWLSHWIPRGVLLSVFGLCSLGCTEAEPNANTRQASQAVSWSAGTSYQAGDLVTYGGKTYQAVQSHTGYAGWEPPNVAALWVEVTSGAEHDPSNNPAGVSQNTNELTLDYVLKQADCHADPASCCPPASQITNLTGAADTHHSTEANRCVVAGGGSDTIYLQSSGPSALHLGPGDDTAMVGPGNDIVWAGDGRDTINAYGGTNIFFAGAGDDTVMAANGENTVIPGPGRDTVALGTGNDIVYIFDSCEVAPGETISAGSGTDILVVPVPLAQLSNLNVSGFEHIVVQDNSCLSECAPTVPCKKIEATEEWAVASTQTGQLGKAVPLVDGSVMVASRNSVFQVTAEGGLIVRASPGGPRRFQLGETGEFSYYRSTTVEHFGDSGGFLGSHLYDGFALSRFVPQSNSLIILEARVEHHEPSLDSFRVVSAAGTSATYETEGMLNSAVTVAGLVYSTDTQLVSRGLDGAELWRTDAPLRETKASKNGNSLMGVRRGPGSHIVHIDQSTGALAGEHSLPTPVWAFGFSPSGDYSYAATKTHVYVYLDGTLLRTHQVPHEALTTADVSDTGAIVVGGKSAGVTQIYLADALADTPWKGTGTADAQAYRPYVRFRPGSLEFVSIEHGSLDSYTVEKN